MFRTCSYVPYVPNVPYKVMFRTMFRIMLNANRHADIDPKSRPKVCLKSPKSQPKVGPKPAKSLPKVGPKTAKI